jgi:hypothetical protein
MAAIALSHTGNDKAAEVQDCAQVDIDQEINVLRICLQKFLRPVDTRAIDEHVDLDAVRELRDGGAVTDVDRVRDTASAVCQRFQRFGTPGQRMNLKAFAPQALDDGEADAR